MSKHIDHYAIICEYEAASGRTAEGTERVDEYISKVISC